MTRLSKRTNKEFRRFTSIAGVWNCLARPNDAPAFPIVLCYIILRVASARLVRKIKDRCNESALRQIVLRPTEIPLILNDLVLSAFLVTGLYRNCFV